MFFVFLLAFPDQDFYAIFCRFLIFKTNFQLKMNYLCRTLTHIVPTTSFAVCRTASTRCPYEGDEILVPDEPYSKETAEIGTVPEFDQKLITHLERLSLVRFSNEEAAANLRESVRIANRLKHVNVDGVDPMYTVWDSMECPLRDDNDEECLSRTETLSNASKVVEDYFVTPPGNVPLEESGKLDLKLINQWDELGKRVAEDPRKKRNSSH